MKDSIEPTIRFNEVLVTDALAWTLFGMAEKEGLLYTANAEGFNGRPPTARNRQAVLSLFVLFDKLIVHDFSPESGTFRLPDLERDGVLEVVPGAEPSLRPPPLRSSWNQNKQDPRLKAPVRLRQSLALIQRYKPLILDRLLSVRYEFHAELARALGISMRVYYSELIDLATNYATGHHELLSNNILEQRLPTKFLKKTKRGMFWYKDVEEEGLDPVNAILLASVAFAEELALIREVSGARGLGVATRHYARAGRVSLDPGTGFSVSPSDAPRSFGLVRSVLHEEGHFFPEIESIAHAVKLRKNPHLRAFKEQFREFHEQLAHGDRDALEKVRGEVRRSKRALERVSNWNLGLHWLTYIALPIAGVECLLGGAPIIGASLAVMKAAGTATSARASQKNRWVMFGV